MAKSLTNLGRVRCEILQITHDAFVGLISLVFELDHARVIPLNSKRFLNSVRELKNGRFRIHRSKVVPTPGPLAILPLAKHLIVSPIIGSVIAAIPSLISG